MAWYVHKSIYNQTTKIKTSKQDMHINLKAKTFIIAYNNTLSVTVYINYY